MYFYNLCSENQYHKINHYSDISITDKAKTFYKITIDSKHSREEKSLL